MKQRPSLKTERLILRPFKLSDAPDVQRLAGDKEIAATTLNIPHPYEAGMAEAWIESHQEKFEKEELVNFAIERRADTTLVGAIGLVLNLSHHHAEMGYWVGKPYWNNGYITEAARAVMNYGFEVLNLNRIFAAHFKSNPASGRIMQKIGMKHEGTFRQHVFRWGDLVDLEFYGVLHREYTVKR